MHVFPSSVIAPSIYRPVLNYDSKFASCLLTNQLLFLATIGLVVLLFSRTNGDILLRFGFLFLSLLFYVSNGHFFVFLRICFGCEHNKRKELDVIMWEGGGGGEKGGGVGVNRVFTKIAEPINVTANYARNQLELLKENT